jgi:5'(3')-deoxyribonucleotidase
MVSKVLYLDMDGVLVNFVGGVCRALGTTEEELIARHSPPVPWDLRKLFGRSFGEIEAKLDEGFWSNLDKYPWADELVEYVTGYFPNRVVLCTSAGRPGTSFFHQAAIGKSLWVHKHFPEFADSMVMCCQKWHLAGGGKVLVDDSTKQVLEFASHGGTGIVFPQWWNCRWLLVKYGVWIDVVKEAIKALAEEDVADNVYSVWT